MRGFVTARPVMAELPCMPGISTLQGRLDSKHLLHSSSSTRGNRGGQADNLCELKCHVLQLHPQPMCENRAAESVCGLCCSGGDDG
jgi:hypothetical protein